MKKITFLILAFLSFQFSFSQCDFTITLSDTYGDGWTTSTTDYHTIDVAVGGTVVLDDITIGDGFAASYTFEVSADGDPIDVVFTDAGNWSGECGYTIYDNIQEVVTQQQGAGDETAAAGPADTSALEVICSDGCPSPQINMWSMTSDGVEFDGNNSDAITAYQVEYSTSSFTPGDGTASVYEFDSFPHTMTGLEPATTYYFAMRSVCGDSYGGYIGNPDAWSTSSCLSSYSLPYFNDFGEYNAATQGPAAEAITDWSNCNSFYNLDDDNPDPGFYNFWFLLPLDMGNGFDNCAASYSVPDFNLDPDNWFVLGPIDLTNEPNAMLTWDMLNGGQPDFYSVYVGTSNSTEDFVESSLVSYEETTTDEHATQWNARELDISAAVGNEVYIAFRHHNSASLVAIGIDNVSVTSNTMSNEDFELENIDYTFNQETDILKVNSDELLSNLEIFNIMGQKVLYQNLNDNSAILNLSTLSSGVYIVNVEGNNSKIKTFKLAIK